MKIVKAPPVLQVQLLRYVYDRVTWEKKKLRDAIETTASIKIDEDGTSVDYDLCALVLHRGAKPTSCQNPFLTPQPSQNTIQLNNRASKQERQAMQKMVQEAL